MRKGAESRLTFSKPSYLLGFRCDFSGEVFFGSGVRNRSQGRCVFDSQTMRKLRAGSVGWGRSDVSCRYVTETEFHTFLLCVRMNSSSLNFLAP
jgi:hypothetical protein